MSNRRNVQFTYNPHNKATILDCSFVVDSTNGNGLGIRNLKGSGRVAAVFMHTSATAGVAAGITNPNPQNGVIVVYLQDNYNAYLGGYAGTVAPISGTPISISGSSVMTVGNVYTIVSLGSSTTANWQAVGLLPGITPAVGVSFIASVTGGGSGTGQVEAPKSTGSGIDHIEVFGDANLANNTGAQIVGAGVGMQIISLCYSGGTLTAPANGTVIGMNFYLNDSAQGV